MQQSSADLFQQILAHVCAIGHLDVMLPWLQSSRPPLEVSAQGHIDGSWTRFEQKQCIRICRA